MIERTAVQSLAYGRDLLAHLVAGGARGIGLGIVTAIVESGGSVAILDILPTPHPDCQALIEDTDRVHYFW